MFRFTLQRRSIRIRLYLTCASIIMQGTSPFAYRSPSLHSSSYLPRLEANFMKDFSCCGLHIPTLQELYQHCEERHAGAGTASGTCSQQKETSKRDPPPNPKAAHANVAASNIKMGNNGPQKPPPLDAAGKGHARPIAGDSAPPTPRQVQPAQNVMRGFAPAHVPPKPSFSTQVEDGMSDMEMDDDFASSSNDDPQSQYSVQNHTRISQRSQFGPPSSSRVPPLNLNTSNMANPMQQQYQGLRNSQPPTPVTAGRSANMYQNNPTVSSVNTPTLSTYTTGTYPLQQQQYYTPDSSAPGTPGEVDPTFLDGMQAMSMENTQLMPNNYGLFPFHTNTGLLGGYIDDPATNLLTAGPSRDIGGPAQGRQQQEETAAQLGDAQYSEDSELAQTIRAVQKENGVPDPSADGVPKPFHCPVIGCEKAYKNQNGLKYHKTVRVFFQPHPRIC